LFFMSIWGLPLITALVAGDIVASETQNGTLKTILTRSRERGEVFAGKVLATATYTLALVFALGVVGLVAGSIAWGFHPLTSLSGTQVAAGHGLLLLLASLVIYALPGTEGIRPYLLATQFEAWHGFLRVPADWAPVVRALWVCALYIGIPLAA